MRQKAWPPRAPSVPAAGTRFVGICCITEAIVRIASGIRAWVIPIITPVKL